MTPKHLLYILKGALEEGRDVQARYSSMESWKRLPIELNTNEIIKEFSMHTNDEIRLKPLRRKCFVVWKDNTPLGVTDDPNQIRWINYQATNDNLGIKHIRITDCTTVPMSEDFPEDVR